MSAAEIFRNEARELLTEIEECILDVEKDSTDMDSINKLFRAMHTIKGSGAMFGFDDIANFTHHVETTMDLVRSNRMSVSKELIDLVLKSNDYIAHLFECFDSESEFDSTVGDDIIVALHRLDPDRVEAYTNDQTVALPTQENKDDSEQLSYRISYKPKRHYFANGSDPAIILSELSELGESVVFARLGNVPDIDSIHPEECYLEWDILLRGACTEDDIKDVFIFVEDECDLTIGVIDTDEESAHVRIGEILVDRGEIDTEKLNSFLKKQKPIGELLVENNIIEPEALESALVEQSQIDKIKSVKQKNEIASTIRVPADKLDSLVDLVGELVTVQARLAEKTIYSKDSDLSLISEEIERLTSGLRDETMSIRMLQIGSTFSTYKRLVRDLSSDLGKSIELQTSGGETELDKTVIEQLKNPLVHLIRNSIDHGIENKEERQRAGKQEKGIITLSASHAGAQVYITIKDDGKGLNPEIIKNKAIEKNIIPVDSDLSDAEIFQLIFAPGFSTADSITDVSGRGVGMDVVKQNIESLRGTIEIESEVGTGTTITLKLPLTLAIIDGLMVVIDDDFYIIPLSSVEECLEINNEDINKVEGRNIINLRGEAVPYVLLRERFNITTQAPNLEQVVITQIGDKRIGFVVDKVIGGHQTVIKSLGKAMKKSEYISGATILGDGTVALIIEVNKLI